MDRNNGQYDDESHSEGSPGEHGSSPLRWGSQEYVYVAGPLLVQPTNEAATHQSFLETVIVVLPTPAIRGSACPHSPSL